MKGIEGAGKGKPLGKSLDAPEVQAAAMLAAFKSAHHEANIDPAHPERTDPATFGAAAEEWIGDPDDPTTPAAKFRMFAQEHPDEHLGLNNRKKLRELIAKIEKKNLH